LPAAVPESTVVVPWSSAYLREIKTEEERIALTAVSARGFSDEGHRVLVEVSAGAGSSFRDEEFMAASAE